MEKLSRVMLKLTKRSLQVVEVMQPLRFGQDDYLKRAWPAVPRALCEEPEESVRLIVYERSMAVEHQRIVVGKRSEKMIAN